MSKPSLDSLEAIALKNRLDLLVVQARDTQPDKRDVYIEQIKTIAARYEILTNKPYVYADAWTREID